MSEFVTLECKYCGNADRSTFIIRESEYICKCCGRAYRENATGGESRTAMAFEMLKNYDFSSAENIFSDIISEYPESIDARWGLLLARYGIVFVKGFYMGEIEPIYCFPNVSYSKGAFTDEPEYREIENLLGADAKRMELYRAQAEQIDSALGVYRGDVCKEKEYDVFICVKISKTTANNPFAKGTTEDYEKACELYGKLRERGKRVFFSYVTLKNTIDSDIEIWRSLLKSKKMLLIGSRTEYFNSVWVKSEWERWLWLDTAGGDEHKKNLYIYVLGSESDNLYSKLPAGIKKFQPQIYTAETEADLLNDICRGDEPKKEKKPKPEKAPKPERTPKPEKAPAPVQETSGEGYVEFLDGTKAPLSAYGFFCYQGRNDVVSAVVPEGVTEITSTHFGGCANLEKISLPKSLRAIEPGAFSGCSRLASIEIPVGVTEIKEQAFYMCKNLSYVKLPFGLQKIGSGAFMLCGNLRKIELPETLSVIDTDAFYSSGLCELTVPKSVQAIEKRAFALCKNLKKTTLYNTVDRIEEDAFDKGAKIVYFGTPEEFKRAYIMAYTGKVRTIELRISYRNKGRTFAIFMGIAAVITAISAISLFISLVPNGLHWAIAVLGGIALNIIICLVSNKLKSGVLFLIIIELIACFFALTSLFGEGWEENIILCIYSFGVSLGVFIVSIPLREEEGYWVLSAISAVFMIASLLGIIVDSFAVSMVILVAMCIAVVLGIVYAIIAANS